MGEAPLICLRPSLPPCTPKYSYSSYNHWLPGRKKVTDLPILQKILAAGFISISILGMSCIFLVGGVIIVLLFTVAPLLAWCATRMGQHQYAKLEWTSNDTFQLQRLGQEASGMGTWSRGTALIPVTQPRELLAALDVADPEHPRLPTMGVNWRLTQESSDDALGAEDKRAGG